MLNSMEIRHSRSCIKEGLRLNVVVDLKIERGRFHLRAGERALTHSLHGLNLYEVRFFELRCTG